jgi:asparagine synthase (glutamine-hydrolysing)
MCGIAGVVNFSDHHDPPSIEILSSMVSALKHRGPDEYGMYRDTHAGLGHARLSIIDLSTGQQPLSNEDGTLWVCFNGEIFNFVELRSELERLGHKFRTHSDTEVIVHAYEAWGADCFSLFNGQWAVALWDSANKRLVLSRDRIGVRPLYVYERGLRVWFGSEVKAIFADPSVPRSIDVRGLDQTFTYWAAIAPLTIYKGVEELRPGSTRVYHEDGTRRDVHYWRASYPTAEENPTSIEEAAEILLEKLTRATRLRTLRADVPVGSYLSGGLDSSLIARLGRDTKDGTFQTFSVRFEDAEFDETSFQRTMAATLDSNHHEIVVAKGDIARLFPEVIRHTERPILRTAPAPLLLLSRLVRDAGFKVVLTGEGADEMLAGYDLFREAKIRTFWSHQPDSKIRPRLFDKLYPYLARSPQQARGMALAFWRQGLDQAHQPGFSHVPRWSTTRSLRKFFSAETRGALESSPTPDYLDTLPKDFHQWDPLAQAQFIEVETLLSSYLISSQGDRMLMANSVEGRFPFLDMDVMSFCNSLRAQHKLIGLNEKFILKKAAKGLVPDEIIRRQKQPYRAPDAISFVGRYAPEYVQELLSERALQDAGFFEVDMVQKLLTKCTKHANDPNVVFSNRDNMGLVGILSTQLVFYQFVSNTRSISTIDIRFSTFIDKVLGSISPN